MQCSLELLCRVHQSESLFAALVSPIFIGDSASCKQFSWLAILTLLTVGRSFKNVYRYPTCLFKAIVSLSTVTLVKPKEVVTIFGCTSSLQ
jgi:hypothetical protein